jgi:hypothetical protein
MIHTFRAFFGGWFAAFQAPHDGLSGRGSHRTSAGAVELQAFDEQVAGAPEPRLLRGRGNAGGSRAERRGDARRRLRLRSGKLLDSQNKFICECLVRDESPQGLCLKLAKNLGLPVRYRFYNDETGTLSVVATIWRRGEQLGVRYCATAKPVSIRESDRSALRGRYYAIPD